MNKEHLLFGSCLFIFILHQVLEKIVHLSPDLADNYLDALVCISLPILHCAGYFSNCNRCRIIFSIHQQPVYS